MFVPDLLEEGCILFNSGKYYEAHEVWEDLWRATPEPGLKACYQGLIQAAVGLHHLSRQNLVGARSQLGKSIRNLQTATSRPSHLDITGFIEQLTHMLNDMPKTVPPGPGITRLK